jgi:excisionase family DNA binding protein
MRKLRRKKERPEVRLEDLPDVLTMEELESVTRLGRSSTYKAVSNGSIPSVRIGGRLLVPKAALVKLLEGAASG